MKGQASLAHFVINVDWVGAAESAQARLSAVDDGFWFLVADAPCPATPARGCTGGLRPQPPGLKG